MKIKRQKQAKKLLLFYKFNFLFREPYQVLLDGTFCQAALKNKIQIKEQMPKYLMGEVQLCTTSCALKELEVLGKDLIGAKLVLQRFQVRRCPHFKSPVSAAQCLLAMLEDNNPHHYFVATQDRTVTEGLRKMPGVPLLYIILNTIVLEKPSASTQDHVRAVQQGELLSAADQQRLRQLKGEEGVAPPDAAGRGKKRKRKQHNPHPLSCLKKKKKNAGPTPPLKKDQDGGARRRKRNKRAKTDEEETSAS